MAAPSTTITKPTDERYTEHDKLGPLGATHPVLADEIQLRAMLVGAFRTAATAAQQAAAAIDKSPAEAVHASRKALRRARAVLVLVAGALPKADRRAIRDALREGRRGLSTTRDHAVAPDSLGQLPLGPAERETADRILANAREALPPIAEIEALLKEGARHATTQADALEVALPPGIAWKVVERGVRRLYRDARSLRKRAKHSRRAFHAWRRRSKELAYQLELLTAHAGARVGRLYAEIEAATDAASSAVDLVMLREFASTYAQGIAPEALEHLGVAIEAQLDDLAKAARKVARSAYKRSPAGFARRLAKAVAKDLTPPPPVEHDSGDEHS